MSKKAKDQVNKIIDKSRLFDGQLKEQIELYLIKEYEKRDLNFSPSSPYGQIIDVLNELNKLQYFYLEDSLNERNLLTAFKENSILGLSRLTGHNPSRPVSAKGELSLKIKPGMANEIPGANIQIQNYSKILCKNNQKNYVIILDSDSVYIPKTSSKLFKFQVVEGELNTSNFTGDNTDLQSFNIPTRFAQIENDIITVLVNGQEFKNFESLYDIKKNEKGVIIKTGINGGVDIYFGNKDYGYIPDSGEKIQVEWIASNGSGGNIGESSSSILLEFVDEVSDGFGGELDLNEIFDISVSKKITMGADAEDKELTRFLLNKNSRGLVLANPTNYTAFLSKYNQFSYIDAFNTFGDEYLDDDNIVYLFLLPDITRKVQSNSDYFSTDINNFYLSKEDKDAVYDVINKSGRQLISTELEIIDPVITNYALNVFIRVYDDIISEDTIKAEITNALGEYFLSLQRRDKIPRSDIIKMIEKIDGIDSVYVDFISKANEEAIFNGYYFKKIDYNNTDATSALIEAVRKNNDVPNLNASNSIETTEKITLKSGENPNLGLDEFGDITIGNKELPIIRGGFTDRNGVEYADGINGTNLSALNIVIRESIPRK
tara:strand:- start:6385 stop:8193 length:1809 start_codon:yes stop_codon:yes gene_type:complete